VRRTWRRATVGIEEAMAELLQPPVTRPPREGDASDYAWPTPDLACYPAPTSPSSPPACDIEGVNGKVIEGRLIHFDPVRAQLQLQRSDARTPLTLRFDQFRRLRLRQPLAALPPPEGMPDLAERPVMAFSVRIHGVAAWEGRTLGYREEAWGLFLFGPGDDKGTLRRWFVPRSACESAAQFSLGSSGIAGISVTCTTPANYGVANAAASIQMSSSRTRRYGRWRSRRRAPLPSWTRCACWVRGSKRPMATSCWPS